MIFLKLVKRICIFLHHEELESLAINIPGVKRIRFFMTVSERYLTHLKVLENVGMTSIEPIEYEGTKNCSFTISKSGIARPGVFRPENKREKRTSAVSILG